jgi:CelD/BcsL family acetyltransferase involved in cellulose biosynthesis
LQVVRLHTWEEAAGLADAWNELSAGVPFRTWEWNSTWWRHYGDTGELYLLCVRQRGQVVALVPWFRSRHPARGRILRFLASGEVCSDYQTVLCMPGREGEVAAVIAQWLTSAAQRGNADDGWDLLDFSGIEAADAPMQALLEALRRQGCRVHLEDALNCWRLELTATWEDYLRRLSKSHRSQAIRRVRNYFDTGRAVWHTVSRADELPAALDTLIELHHRRWAARNQPGLFDSPRYAAFHREVAERMFARGQLRLHWLTLDGRPAAAEYYFAGAGVSYLYQGGMEPELFQDNPGNLAHLAAIRGAMAEGYRAIDFLRGDEPYKRHFRAEPRPCCDIRVVPPKVSSRLRDRAWQAGRRVKRWLNRNSSPALEGGPAAKHAEKAGQERSSKPKLQPAEVEA